MSFDSTKCFDAGVLAPQIQMTLAWYTMATDIILCSVEHSLAYIAIQIRIVIVYYPLALSYSLWVVEGMVVCGYQLRGIGDILPVDVFRDSAKGDDWT